MSFKKIFRFQKIKIIFTFFIPLTLWYGTVYRFEDKITGKPIAYKVWKIYPFPQIINIPMIIKNWFGVYQRVISDTYITDGLITILVSLFVNYLISCILFSLFSFLKTKKQA